jgi:prolyl oligopeptidase
MPQADRPPFAQDADHDPNLWLEDIEGEAALAWVRAQNARALAQLTGDSRFAKLERDAIAIANDRDRLALGAVRDGYLYNFWQDETNVRGLWRRTLLADYARGEPVWRTLLDLDALARAENANWVFKGVIAREGSSRCMIGLSDGGKDSTLYREFDTQAGGFVSEGFMAPEAKSLIAWADDDRLFVATDWGLEHGEPTVTESGYPYIVKAWARGTPLSTATEVIRGARRDISVGAWMLEDIDGAELAVASQATSFFEQIHFRLDRGAPERITLPPKSAIAGLFKGQLLFTLQEDWLGAPSGSLCAYRLGDSDAAAPRLAIILAPGPREAIESVAITADAVLVSHTFNVRSRLTRFDFDGAAWSAAPVQLPENGAIAFAGASHRQSIAFVTFEDFLTPSTLYVLEERAATARPVRALAPQFDAAPYMVEQFEAPSSDGASIPYFVIRRKDLKHDGSNPTLLYAYGGFQVSLTPAYAPNVGKLWLEHGGVYVLANIRGGGEFGPTWHQAGLKTKRQLIYDDFYAVERDLAARGVASARRLGIEGGSNGGLLMGVMLNQHPEMISAAVVQVPLLDMLRYDQLLAGASWVDEYGSPQQADERVFLEAISPYQNLRARPDFPTPLVLTSTKDDRVHPGHARKYVARLNQLGMPVLYFENIDGGHAAAANLNEAAHRRALEYVYLMQRLMD